MFVDGKYEPGGGGIKCSPASLRCSAATPKHSISAGGEMGSFLDRLLDEQKIRRRRIPVSGPDPHCFRWFRNNRRDSEYRFIPAGQPVRPEEIKLCFDAILSQDLGYVIASGSLPPAAPEDTFARMAKSAANKELSSSWIRLAPD